MSKAIKLDNDVPFRYQWVLDDAPASLVSIGKSAILQVDGLTAGEVVNLRGGLTHSSTHLLAVIRNDGVEVIPPVHFVYPEGPAGTTVTIMGAQ
jgi:hypothetical protein